MFTWRLNPPLSNHADVFLLSLRWSTLLSVLIMAYSLRVVYQYKDYSTLNNDMCMCICMCVCVCVCVYWLQCRGASASINSRQSPVYVDCSPLQSVSRTSAWNNGRKVAARRPSLSHIIEFTRRRHICIWDNDPSTAGGRRGSRARSTQGLGSSAAVRRRSSQREPKWRRNMSNRTAFRRVKICIGIAARRSLRRVEWVRMHARTDW